MCGSRIVAPQRRAHRMMQVSSPALAGASLGISRTEDGQSKSPKVLLSLLSQALAFSLRQREVELFRSEEVIPDISWA